MALFALLVGIDHYRPPVRALRGCVADVAAAADLLRSLPTAAHVEVLLNERATRAAVIEALRGHLGRATEGDTAIFWFSGHGSTAPLPPSLWHSEADGRSQTLLCADSRHDGVPDLYDRELGLLVREVARTGALTVVIVDACHAESATRDGLAAGARATVRRHEDSGTAPPPATLLPALRHPPGDDPVFVELAAAHSFESAHEMTVPGAGTRGVFSHGLLRALELRGAGSTCRELLTAARRSVENVIDGQVPRLHPDHHEIVDRPLLGGPPRPPARITMRYVRGSWEIDAGACHGMRAGVRMSLPGSGRRITVLSVLTARCIVEPDGWTPDEEAQYPVTTPAAYGFATARRSSGLDGAIRLELSTPDGLPVRPGTDGVVRWRRATGIRLHNTTRRRLYAVLLHLTADLGVSTVLFPAGAVPGLPAAGPHRRARRRRADRDRPRTPSVLTVLPAGEHHALSARVRRVQDHEADALGGRRRVSAGSHRLRGHPALPAGPGRRRVDLHQALGAIVAAAAAGVVLLACLGTSAPPYSDLVFGVVLLGMLAIHVGRLWRVLTRSGLHALVVTTAKPQMALVGRDEALIRDLKERVIDAIDNPALEFAMTVENVLGDKVLGDKIMGYHVEGDQISYN
ncbi:hypothetical protein J2S43_001657 [Catenuloplanes nepalensis]|uniref:Peptidase C14 caspase domain-containing protein n=1 Tax=Catenuloplanes nepalensis TaxID=587533 RepID=A0ABT9MNY6_9ACTN|nr:caspase family protein [Catenuloplanes nepalensis]MDP9793145.1 hypothetical protein [Catenuloplanes nepalensis]